MNETNLSARTGSSKLQLEQAIKKPEKKVFILNRKNGVFESDSARSGDALEFKLADYAIKHVLSDFENQSNIQSEKLQSISCFGYGSCWSFYRTWHLLNATAVQNSRNRINCSLSDHQLGMDHKKIKKHLIRR